MNISKVLSSIIGLGLEYTWDSPYADVMFGCQSKFQYAGLSKNSPSHAQQKRDSKKAKNRRSK